MTLLAIDIGTTHCKAGLFAENGSVLHVATRPLPRRVGLAGAIGFAPDAVWEATQQVVREATAAAGRPQIAAIGIASMAETGLLLDRHTGEARTDMLAWFDQAAAQNVVRIRAAAPETERFGRFGIYPGFKNSLAKILWARDHGCSLQQAVWLGAAEYVAFRLTGRFATDYSLAGRTYAFDLAERAWDEAWLRAFDLPPDLFPVALPSGTPMGMVQDTALATIGLQLATPVAIAGHDHVCAAIAANATIPGRAFDSMGTAEALLGTFDRPSLDDAALASGLTFGVLPLAESLYWLGGLSSSGGALDWLRGILGDPPVTYEELQELQAGMDVRPGDITFLPYLAGSGAPVPNPTARGALIGLALDHTRADLVQAVLEGTAYQMQAIRRAAETLLSPPIETIAVAGGGARNRRWLEIKAAIYGAQIEVLALDEATLFGAALVAGVGCAVYRNPQEAFAIAVRQDSDTIVSNPQQQRAYAERFESHFLPWLQRGTAAPV